MPGKRSTRPFAEELPELLWERSLSLRALAGMFGVGDDQFSRVVRGACGKRVSADLTRRVAKALNLPEDYFMEARIAFVVEHLSDDPALLDRIYDELRH